jgi:signal peptidase II
VTGSRARAWSFAGALAGMVVVLDQVAKAVVEAQLTPGEDVGVLGPLELTLSHNTGIAFGLASGGGALLVALPLVALVAIGAVFSRDPTRRGMWVAVGLLAGGALGNLVDRVRVDAVTDYVQVGSWPAFNVADVAVTAGVLLFVLAYLHEDGSR